MDNIKNKIHWWPDDVLRTHYDEIVEWQRTRVSPVDSLLLSLASEYDIDTRELEHLIIAESERVYEAFERFGVAAILDSIKVTFNEHKGE